MPETIHVRIYKIRNPSVTEQVIIKFKSTQSDQIAHKEQRTPEKSYILVGAQILNKENHYCHMQEYEEFHTKELFEIQARFYIRKIQDKYLCYYSCNNREAKI